MFSFLKSKVKKFISLFSKAKFSIGNKLKSLFSKKPEDFSYQELEQLFYEADLGVATSIELVEKVKSLKKKNPEISTEELLTIIHQELLGLFIAPKEEPPKSPSPYIILMVGVNGSGKTTSLAKLAKHYQDLNKKVLLVAADTYRAAATEQLEKWANKLHIDLIKSKQGSDPSSVVFDALSAAKARNTDVVLIDTAGRLQTKTDLMKELEKIRRICQKQIPKSPHETLLVVDATTGQNGLDQAKIFHQYTPIDGIILTKLDGSAKGGIVVAIQKELKIPILWVGMGEKEEDLVPFDPKEFIDVLLSINE